MKKICLFILLIPFAFVSYLEAQPVNGMTTFFTNTTTAINANTSCSITKTCTLSGWLFSISSTSNCGHNWTNSTGGDGRFQNLVGFGTLTEITFGSDDGSEFALNNLTWGVSTSSWTSKAMKFVGYKNGLPVSGATLNATTPSGTGISNTLVVTFTSNPAFNDVDDIRLAPNSATCNSILFFEDITVSTATPSCISPTLTLSGQTNVLCNGNSTGSATMAASGGAPFTYTWSPSGGNSAIASGLSAGIYTCACTNSCGSTANRTVNITQPPAIAGSTAITNPLCNGSMGSATITASGGSSPYTYTWSSGPTSSVEPTLLAGTYTVKITDANNCNITRSVTITQPPALLTSTAATNILCFGNSTGAATVTASGGTPNYTYFWSTAATTSVISGQTSGIKTVTVTDANGCISTKSVAISQPTSALNTATAITNVLCSGNSTGAATVIASGGTPNYTYLWSTAATTSVISGQTSGIKTVTVTDANGCISTKSVAISQPTSALNTATALTNVLCFGNSTGAATVTASGGTPNYTYLWSTAATTSVISGQTSGIKTVTVTDANGCTSTKSVNITQPNAFTLTATANNTVICNSGSSTLTANGSGGTGTITYSWVSGPTNSVSVVSPTTTSIYTVNISDANNCTSSQTVAVNVNTNPTVTVNSGSICSGNSFTIVPSGANTYTIEGGNSVVTPTSNSNYTVIGESAAGCISVNTATASVIVNQNPTITAVSSETNFICEGQTATLTANGASSYVWNTTATTAVIVVSPTITTSYTVNGTDANGCTSSAIVTQSVDACTGIKSSKNSNFIHKVSVYPNPNNGKIIIEVGAINESTTLVVSNVVGQIVYNAEMTSGKTTIDISEHPNGIYFVKVMSGSNTMATGKIVKQ